MASRFIYAAAGVRISSVFKVEFHSFVFTHLVYPSVHWWALGSLPPSAAVTAAVNGGVPLSVPGPAFSLLGAHPDVELVAHMLMLC